MTVARTTGNKTQAETQTLTLTQTLKARITEDLDRGSGSLNQAVEKTKDAFGRDGSGTR